MSQNPLKADMLNTQVYTLLKRDILHHKIRPGERLVDSQIALRYGISRTPVRDAIFKLAREGLVVNKDRRGFYVLEVSAADIDELYDIRLMIEIQSLRLLIRRNMAEWPEETAVRLREIREKSRECAEKGEWLQADEFFHDALIALLGNKRVGRIFEEIRNQTRVFRQLTSEVDQRVKIGMEWHDRIIDAMLARDEEQTEALVREHIEAGRREAHEDVHERD